MYLYILFFLYNICCNSSFMLFISSAVLFFELDIAFKISLSLFSNLNNSIFLIISNIAFLLSSKLHSSCNNLVNIFEFLLSAKFISSADTSPFLLSSLSNTVLQFFYYLHPQNFPLKVYPLSNYTELSILISASKSFIIYRSLCSSLIFVSF